MRKPTEKQMRRMLSAARLVFTSKDHTFVGQAERAIDLARIVWRALDPQSWRAGQ